MKYRGAWFHGNASVKPGRSGRDPSERPAPRVPRHHAPQFLQRATTIAPRADDDFED
jgi:hypothetical protein